MTLWNSTCDTRSLQWKLRGIKPKYSIFWFFFKNLKMLIPKISTLSLNHNQMPHFHCALACAPHKRPKWSPSPSKPKRGVSEVKTQTSLRLKWQQPCFFTQKLGGPLSMSTQLLLFVGRFLTLSTTNQYAQYKFYNSICCSKKKGFKFQVFREPQRAFDSKFWTDFKHWGNPNAG